MQGSHNRQKLKGNSVVPVIVLCMSEGQGGSLLPTQTQDTSVRLMSETAAAKVIDFVNV